MSWGGWSIQPSLAYVVVAGALYWAGGRGMHRRRPERKREAAFVAGLVVIVLALDSPVDGYADTLFWVHMAQHIMLLSVAPPLILLGRPWPRMWRALPLRFRTRTGRALAKSPWAAPIRTIAHPIPAWLLFNGTLVAWHIPGAYDATLTSGIVHDVEHAMFFFTGLLFWARVIDPGPLRPRMAWPARIAYVVGSMTVGWVLAVILVLAPHPLYPYYAALAHRPGGLTALGDQQLAGGIMWVPGSTAFAIALMSSVYRWLDPNAAARPRSTALTT